MMLRSRLLQLSREWLGHGLGVLSSTNATAHQLPPKLIHQALTDSGGQPNGFLLNHLYSPQIQPLDAIR